MDANTKIKLLIPLTFLLLGLTIKNTVKNLHKKSALKNKKLTNVDRLNSKSLKQQWICPFDLKQTLDKTKTPKYQLDPNKFIINVSPFGPNNQFHGFRDTIMLAIYLNRTLILPKFFKHRSDPSYSTKNFTKNVQDAEEKVDINALSEFISIKQFEKLSQVCATGLDVVLEARRGGDMNQLKMYEELSGVKMLNGSDFLTGKIVHLEADEQKKLIKMNQEAVDVAYGSKLRDSDKCVLWWMPFMNLEWPYMLGNQKHYPNEYRTVTDMLLATRRAPSVLKISQSFSKQVMKSSFAAIHWRYDLKDFGAEFGVCNRGKGVSPVCKWLEKGGFNATDLGTKMLNWLNKQKVKLGTIYFATPPIEIPFIQNVSKILVASGYQVYHQTHLREFIRNKFDTCDENRFDLQLHDFVSQTEQQLCTDAGIFLASESSTWSGAITEDRRSRNLTENDGSNVMFL